MVGEFTQRGTKVRPKSAPSKSGTAKRGTPLPGALRPAPSTAAGSPSRPDPRPGHRRARPLRLLPALALLLGALSPSFAARPAAAEVLVGNFGKTVSSAVVVVASTSHAQGFTTGSFSAGYVLSGIDVRLNFAGTESASFIENYRAELWSSNNSGAPDSKLASLGPPASASSGSNVIVAFTAPGDTKLTANTAYHLVLYRSGAQYSDQVRVTASTGEDAGGETGSSISDSRYSVNASPPSGTWTKSTTGVLLIRVNGSRVGAVTPPAAPADLHSDPSPGFGELSLTWTAPPGTMTRYEVHYTSSTTAAADAAVQVGSSPSAASGWVAVSRTAADTTASQIISNLTGGTAYRLRVRAVNEGVPSPWAFGRGVPRSAPASVAWSATLTVKDITGSTNNGCLNSGTPLAEKCSTAATLTEDEFTVGGTDYQIVDITNRQSRFYFNFTGTPNNALRALNVCVGTTAFALSGIYQSGGVWTVESRSPGFLWSPGDTVSLRIASSCAAASTPATPQALPSLSTLTLTVDGTPLTLSRGLDNEKSSYTAVVPYGTTQVTVTPTWTDVGARVQVASYRERGDGDRTLSPRREVQSGNSFTVSLAPSVGPDGQPLPLWKRYTDMVVHVYRRFEHAVHTQEWFERKFLVTIMQGGPLPVTLKVTPLTILDGGTATVTVSIPAPLPEDRVIPLTVLHDTTEEGDVRFRPDPERFPQPVLRPGQAGRHPHEGRRDGGVARHRGAAGPRQEPARDV